MPKSYWNTAQYQKAQKELEIYFEITSENSADKDRFNEMVVLISRIEEKTSQAGKANANTKKFIPLEVAQKEGVPSPPYNSVVGKTYTYRETSVNSGIRYDYLRIHRIVDRDPAQPVFSLELTSVDQTKTPPEQLSPMKFKIREDGTCKSSAAAFFFDDFQCSGDIWPKGRLKTGDSWTTEVSWGDFKSNSTYRIKGFKNINGHDCIDISTTSLNKHGSNSPSKTTNDFCWDYNNGVLVIQTMQVTKDYHTKTELISVHFPEE